MSLRLFIPLYQSDKVAADSIADDDADVQSYYINKVCRPIRYWYCEVIERVGDAVWKAAHDEDWHSEEQWQPTVFVLSKAYGGGHDEAATDGEYAAAEDSVLKT